MKKITYLLLTALTLYGCSSDDNDNQESTNPNDLDGDGVTNQQEVIDGTDPENPCDYILENIFFPDSSNNWRNLDCDQDGVTNGIELDPDGNNAVDIGRTDPQDGCSLRVPKQTLIPSTEWKTGDCDDDSFSNAQEVIDETDLNDPCSFILGNQDLESTVTYRRGDCDEDGRTNLEEIIEGTDIFDANDPFEDGTIISEIKLAYSYLDEIPYWSITYTDNGTKIDEFKKEGVLKTKFHYDANDKLSLVEKFSSPSLTVNYEFFYDAQNRINSITINTTDNGQVSLKSFNYVYENNNINYYENGNLKRSVVLNANNKVSNIYYYEPYFDPDISHSRFNMFFTYSDSSGHLQKISELQQNWNVMYNSYQFSTTDYLTRTFGYNQTRPNDYVNCYSNIYFNFILALDIFEFHYYFNNTSAVGLFEDNFQTFGGYFTETGTIEAQGLIDFYYQPNGYPFTCKGGNNTYNGGRKYYFVYE